MERIVVLGGGESGTGAAVLAKVKGFEVFLSDLARIGETHKAMLDQYGIEYEEGGHTPEKILNASCIVKSPGIPETAPLVKEAYARGMTREQFADFYMGNCELRYFDTEDIWEQK